VLLERRGAAGGVKAAGGVGEERLVAAGGVAVAGGVGLERSGAAGGGAVPARVVAERRGGGGRGGGGPGGLQPALPAPGRVVMAGAIGGQREGTVGRVIAPGVALECVLPAPGVPIRVARVIGRWHLAPTCCPAQCEDETGDCDGASENSSHGTPPLGS